MSDCWRAYDCLSLEGFVHQRVNDSQNFVDPDTGAHTQNIERLWRDVRGGVPRFGRSQKHVVGYLAEFLFKRKFPDHRDRIHAFFTAVAELYLPLVVFESRYQVPCEIPQFLWGLYLCFTAHSRCVYYNLFHPQLPVRSKWKSFITMTHVRNISV